MPGRKGLLNHFGTTLSVTWSLLLRVHSTSNYDHADESCNYLFKDNHIRDFISDDSYDQIIQKAIRYHNKIGIPNNLTSEEELFCKMISCFNVITFHNRERVIVIFRTRIFELSGKGITPIHGKILDISHAEDKENWNETFWLI